VRIRASGNAPSAAIKLTWIGEPPDQQRGFRGRDRRRLCPASEPAAEGLSWTQAPG